MGADCDAETAEVDRRSICMEGDGADNDEEEAALLDLVTADSGAE